MANNHAEDVSRRSHGEASDSGWHEKRLVGNELYDWADFPGGLNKAVAKLANMALKEDWEFGATQDRTKPLPILHAYLRYTFARLKIESDKGQRNKLCYAE